MAIEVADRTTTPTRAALDATWSELTMSREKWSLYMDEPGYVAALTKVIEGPGHAAIEAIQAHAVILVKPEAWIEQRFDEVATFLDRNGFEMVRSFRSEITPLMAREIWRYQWNIAPVERVEASELILSLGPSVGFVLRDLRPVDGVPACVRLARLKGPSKPDRQRPGHLRYELRAPNRIVSLVHIPDEPADMIRDLSLLLGRREMTDLLAMVTCEELPALAVGALRLAVSKLAPADSSVMIPGGLSMSQRVNLIEGLVHEYRRKDGCYQVPANLWAELLSVCGDIAQLPTLGAKRVQPLADLAS